MYRHRLPPGFVLKADKKKQEEDAKKEKISLEDFLEVEVSSPRLSSSGMSLTRNLATQAKATSYTRHARVFRHLEEDTFGEKGCRARGFGEGKERPAGSWKAHRSIWSCIVRSWRRDLRGRRGWRRGLGSYKNACLIRMSSSPLRMLKSKLTRCSKTRIGNVKRERKMMVTRATTAHPQWLRVSETSRSMDRNFLFLLLCVHQDCSEIPSQISRVVVAA